VSINEKITRDADSGQMRENPEREITARAATLRPDLSFFPLDDGLVAFSQASQSLIGLNATAAFIAGSLAKGIPASGLAEALVSDWGAPPEHAENWAGSALAALASQGLLLEHDPLSLPGGGISDEDAAARRRRMPALAPFKPAAETHYRLLGTHALIRYCYHAQKRMVDHVIGHLKTDEPVTPTLIIDVAGDMWDDGGIHITSHVYCNGEPEDVAHKLSFLGPIVKSALWVASVNAHDFLLDLHAGVVGRNGRCILLPAAAGSGKSSLTAALVHSGLDYYSDEVALVERDTFLVPPVPLAVCVKSTGWDLMARYYPQLATVPMHRRVDGKTVRYVPPPPDSTSQKPARVSHIFFPRYVADQPTRLAAMPRAEALAHLMDQCLAFRIPLNPTSVAELVRWIASIDCYSLAFSSLDEAVALVQRTAFAET
jgi:hypothetical protein